MNPFVFADDWLFTRVPDETRMAILALAYGTVVIGGTILLLALF